jgi:KipI family sensor histidine kinase inhibitor
VIRPFGESAVLVEVDDARTARAVAASLAERPPDGVTAVVPGRASVLVELAPDVDLAKVTADLEHCVAACATVGDALGRVRRIPVVFGGQRGPDLARVADGLGQSEDALVERFASLELEVLFLGFAPGFAYLGELPSDLVVSRLATPRPRTPAGSVALADGLAGIYPGDLPGGWPVVGATPISLWERSRMPPTYLLPGDRVRWEPISDAGWSAHAGPAPDW